MKEPAWQVRPMEIADVKVVAEIESSLGAMNWGQELFRGEFSLSESQRYWIVASLGGVIGFAGLMTAAGEATVLNLGVASEHQRCGVGRSLLQDLIETASQRLCEKVWLEVESTNLEAIALYLALGFVEVSERANYYGADRHALVMCLKL